ncbi:MAG: cytidylate kinase family protein, partial [Candidatus Aenigmarchaeota archaeon]|nr:cytidylate kinase family protein [Candidatus Aenigmarchaeota archaeon]
MVVIVISGKPGCGSSTVARLLSEKLSLGHFSVGDYNKSHSRAKREADRSIDVWKGVGAKKKFHLDSDKLARKMADEGNIVIDGKLSVRMLKGHYDYGIWLTAPKKTRIERYAKRDRVDFRTAARKLKEKESLERNNWKRIYGFDYFTQEKEANIVIDTGDKSPDEIVELIISKMRRVFIVHRWAATPRSDWYPFAKEQLEKKGFLVNVLKMPNTNKPVLKEWLPFLAGAIGKPSEKTFLIGHSAGVATILHYLESLKQGEKIGGCVLVAGWVDNVGFKQLTNFVEAPYDYDKIKQHCKRFAVIDSDDDPYVKLYHG